MDYSRATYDWMSSGFSVFSAFGSSFVSPINEDLEDGDGMLQFLSRFDEKATVTGEQDLVAGTLYVTPLQSGEFNLTLQREYGGWDDSWVYHGSGAYQTAVYSGTYAGLNIVGDLYSIGTGAQWEAPPEGEPTFSQTFSREDGAGDVDYYVSRDYPQYVDATDIREVSGSITNPHQEGSSRALDVTLNIETASPILPAGEGKIIYHVSFKNPSNPRLLLDYDFWLDSDGTVHCKKSGTVSEDYCQSTDVSGNRLIVNFLLYYDSGDFADEDYLVNAYTKYQPAGESFAREADKMQVVGEPDCGDRIVEDGELCDTSDDLQGKSCLDFGFSQGVLSCESDCSAFDTGACSGSGCGDGVVGEGEACDGSDFGGKTCSDMGVAVDGTPIYSGGELSCTDQCQIDAGQCIPYNPSIGLALSLVDGNPQAGDTFRVDIVGRSTGDLEELPIPSTEIVLQWDPSKLRMNHEVFDDRSGDIWTMSGFGFGTCCINQDLDDGDAMLVLLAPSRPKVGREGRILATLEFTRLTDEPATIAIDGEIPWDYAGHSYLYRTLVRHYAFSGVDIPVQTTNLNIGKILNIGKVDVGDPLSKFFDFLRRLLGGR